MKRNSATRVSRSLEDVFGIEIDALRVTSDGKTKQGDIQMNQVIKSVNLVDEKDLSLQRMDDRVEFLAATPSGLLGDCGLYVCITNSK